MRMRWHAFAACFVTGVLAGVLAPGITLSVLAASAEPLSGVMVNNP